MFLLFFDVECFLRHKQTFVRRAFDFDVLTIVFSLTIPLLDTSIVVS